MRSPGLATLKEAFDVTYAVHRMEEEGARRRAYNGPGGAGTRGFLHGLNEVDEDEEDEAERAVVDDAKRKHEKRVLIDSGRAGARDQGVRGNRAPAAAPKRRVGPGGGHGFELDLGNATLIGRRHRKEAEPSPLGKISPVGSRFVDTPGSPMRGVTGAAT